MYVCIYVFFQTSEKEILIREQGEGASKKNQASDVVIYKIEVPANRCVCVCVCMCVCVCVCVCDILAIITVAVL